MPEMDQTQIKKEPSTEQMQAMLTVVAGTSPEMSPSPALAAAIDRTEREMRSGKYDQCFCTTRTRPTPTDADIHDVIWAALVFMWDIGKMLVVAAYEWACRNRAACILVAALVASLVVNGLLMSDWDGGVKDAACARWLGDVHLLRAEQKHFRSMNVSLAAQIEGMNGKMDRVLRELDALDTKVWRANDSLIAIKVFGTLFFFLIALGVCLNIHFFLFFLKNKRNKKIKERKYGFA